MPSGEPINFKLIILNSQVRQVGEVEKFSSIKIEKCCKRRPVDIGIFKVFFAP